MIGKRYGKSASGRIATAAMISAFSALVRNHPKAALDMTGAGLKQAGKSTMGEIKHAVRPGGNAGLRGSAEDERVSLSTEEGLAAEPRRS